MVNSKIEKLIQQATRKTVERVWDEGNGAYYPVETVVVDGEKLARLAIEECMKVAREAEQEDRFHSSWAIGLYFGYYEHNE